MKIIEFMIIGIPLVVIFVLLSSVVIFTILSNTKENSYIGHVEVLFLPDVDMKEINNITNNENLTIISIDNITIADEDFIMVLYQADNYREAEKIKENLKKYDIIYDITIYEEI